MRLVYSDFRCRGVGTLALVLTAAAVLLPPSAARAQGATCGTFTAPNTLDQPALGSTNGGANNTACGSGAQATLAFDTAVGFGATATGGGSSAFGVQANANGLQSLALGNSTNAGGIGGDFSVAVGVGASATGLRSLSVGGANASFTVASGVDAVAVGSGARATFDNSVALGAGAATTRANQMSFGAGASTYTLGGVNTDASRAAQAGPLNIVSTDAAGNIAGRTAADLGLASRSDLTDLQSQINGLRTRDSELADGIAISLALAQPVLLPGQVFAVRGGWGSFDGSQALGLTAAGVLAKGGLGPTSSVVVDGGVGASTQENMVAGRAGLTLGF